MYRTVAFFFIGIIAPAFAVGQQSAPRIEKEDIFGRLVPLVQPRTIQTPATSEALPVFESPETRIPDTTNPEQSILIDAAPAPIGTARTQPQQPQRPITTETSPRVGRLLNPSQGGASSDGRPQVIDEARIVQTQGELARLSSAELQQLIVLCAQSLSSELAHVHYGERWQSFLRLSEITAEFVAAEQSTPNANLQMIRDSYSKIARDKQYHMITDRYSFHLLHHGLAEYLSTEQERDDRRGAYDDLGRLQEALTPVPTGHQWREYFALDRAARLLTSAGPLSRDDLGQLQLILARFEQAALEPRFKAVAKLPGFAATHRRLRIRVAVIPDAESGSLTQTELPGRPVPSDQPASVHLVSQEGLTFHRARDAAGWQLADGPVELKSGDSMRTGERGVARLAIGTDHQLVCMPGTLLHVSQYIDEDDRLVTQLHSEQGNLKLSGGTEADAAMAPTGPQIVIVRGQHKIAIGAGRLELDFQHDARGDRTIAAVYRGSIQVRQRHTGDQVTIRAGREAVMLPAGIAVRAAAEKPDAWWPSRRVQTTAQPGNGFTR